MKEITIDAKNKKLGRVASQAASFLVGKHSVKYQRNIVPEVQVHVVNVSGLKLEEKKLQQKKYVSYTGYPGGLKQEVMSQKLARLGISRIVRQTIYGMLPKNKLRAKMIKNLKISE